MWTNENRVSYDRRDLRYPNHKQPLAHRSQRPLKLPVGCNAILLHPTCTLQAPEPRLQPRLNGIITRLYAARRCAVWSGSEI